MILIKEEGRKKNKVTFCISFIIYNNPEILSFLFPIQRYLRLDVLHYRKCYILFVFLLQTNKKFKLNCCKFVREESFVLHE